MSRARWFKILASLALTVILLWFFLSRSGIEAIVEASASADRRLLAFAALAGLASYVLRALRWGLLLMPGGGARLSTLFLATASGYALLALLPARLGDVARPVLLARRDRLPVARALSSVAGERFLDLWCVAGLCVLGLLLLPDQAGGVATRLQLVGAIMAVVLVIGTAVLAAVLRWPVETSRRLGVLAGKLSPAAAQKVESLSTELLSGLRALTQPRLLAACLLASVLTWGLVIVQIGAMTRAFGVEIGFGGWAVLVALSAAGVAAPTPGGAGAVHATVGWGLTGLYGVAAVTADAVAVANHLISFAPITLLGLPCLGWLLARGEGKIPLEEGAPEVAR